MSAAVCHLGCSFGRVASDNVRAKQRSHALAKCSDGGGAQSVSDAAMASRTAGKEVVNAQVASFCV